MIQSHADGRRLTVFLNGEIDHCCAGALKEDMESLLANRRIAELIIDFTGVTFMDSSGVGMLIGRYKTLAARGGKVFARGLSPQVERLFQLAGLHRIMTIIHQEEDANG